MRISDFIKWLENNKELHGDIEIITCIYDQFDDFNPDIDLTLYKTGNKEYLMWSN